VHFLAGGVLAIVCLLPISTIAQTSPPSPTRVVRYTPPSHLPDRVKPGECTSRSVVAESRLDAFRCTAGETIYDLCFLTSNPRQVLCDIDPRDSSSGVVLTLASAQPILDERRPETAAAPWFFELSDGTTCKPLTTAGRVVEGMTELYGCRFTLKSGDYDAVLGDIDMSTPVWTIVKAQINKKIEPQTIKSTTIAVLSTVWR